MSGQEKIYEMVTDEIIKKLEQGVVPWKQPWTGGTSRVPYNYKTKKAYRGINVLLLGLSGHNSRYWMSFKQAQEFGGKVKKGEKGHLCVFWKIITKEEENENGERIEKTIPLLRYYKVFNLDQVEGIEDPDIHNCNMDEAIEEAEQIIENYQDKPEIVSNEQSAYYNPNKDYINIPKFETFTDNSSYYSTLFHEMVHSTGHESRLGRHINASNFFGSEDYSFEELVAELGSSFLCAQTNILNDTIDQSASYINAWLKKLRENKKWIVQASGKAQKAVDYITNQYQE